MLYCPLPPPLPLCSYFIYGTIEGVSFQPSDVPVGPITASLGSRMLIPGLEEVLGGMSRGGKVGRKHLSLDWRRITDYCGRVETGKEGSGLTPYFICALFFYYYHHQQAFCLLLFGVESLLLLVLKCLEP